MATTEGEAGEAEVAAAAPADGGKKRKLLFVGVAVALIAAVGGYFGVRKFTAPPPAPPPAAKAPVTKAPAPAATPAGQPTPPDTSTKIAQAPGNAVKKAEGAVAARGASGQTNIDGETPPGKTATKAPPPTTATTALRPGLTATTQVDSAAGGASPASPAFASFVANAKVTGAVATRATINGRLVRAGDLIEPSLGIRFEGYDYEKRELSFKDSTGAIVVRRYP